jgi:hypothetical protein
MASATTRCRTFGNATTASRTSFPRLSAGTGARFFQSSGAFACEQPWPADVNGAQFYLNGIQIAGQNGTPRGIVNNWFKTYQPRVGFSYDLTGNGKTVLRGGFGTFFERLRATTSTTSPAALRSSTRLRPATWNSPTPATTGRRAAGASPLFTQGPNSENTYLPGAGRGAVQPRRAA